MLCFKIFKFLGFWLWELGNRAKHMYDLFVAMSHSMTHLDI